jgi:hypothetical protein
VSQGSSKIKKSNISAKKENNYASRPEIIRVGEPWEQMIEEVPEI